MRVRKKAGVQQQRQQRQQQKRKATGEGIRHARTADAALAPDGGTPRSRHYRLAVWATASEGGSPSLRFFEPSGP